VGVPQVLEADRREGDQRYRRGRWASRTSRVSRRVSRQ